MFRSDLLRSSGRVRPRPSTRSRPGVIIALLLEDVCQPSYRIEGVDSIHSCFSAQTATANIAFRSICCTPSIHPSSLPPSLGANSSSAVAPHGAFACAAAAAMAARRGEQNRTPSISGRYFAEREQFLCVPPPLRQCRSLMRVRVRVRLFVESRSRRPSLHCNNARAKRVRIVFCDRVWRDQPRGKTKGGAAPEVFSRG